MKTIGIICAYVVIALLMREVKTIKSELKTHILCEDNINKEGI